MGIPKRGGPARTTEAGHEHGWHAQPQALRWARGATHRTQCAVQHRELLLCTPLSSASAAAWLEEMGGRGINLARAMSPKTARGAGQPGAAGQATWQRSHSVVVHAGAPATPQRPQANQGCWQSGPCFGDTPRAVNMGREAGPKMIPKSRTPQRDTHSEYPVGASYFPVLNVGPKCGTRKTPRPKPRTTPNPAGDCHARLSSTLAKECLRAGAAQYY